MNMKAQNRNYKSPLRERQMKETRRTILEVFRDVIHEKGHEAATFKAVAHRAGVQESTVYRHFKNRAELIKASFELASEEDGRPRWPEKGDELLRVFEPTFRYMDANENLIRADLHTPDGRAFMKLVGDQRTGSALKVAKDVAPGLGPTDQKALAIAVTLLYSGPTWEILKDLWGVEEGKGGRLARAAMEMMFEGAKVQEKKRKKRLKS